MEEGRAIQVVELWNKVCGTACIEAHVRENITFKGLCQASAIGHWNTLSGNDLESHYPNPPHNTGKNN